MPIGGKVIGMGGGKVIGMGRFAPAITNQEGWDKRDAIVIGVGWGWGHVTYRIWPVNYSWGRMLLMLVFSPIF